MSDITSTAQPSLLELSRDLLFQIGSAAEREHLLQTNVFEGSAIKKVVPIELLDGGRIEGIFQRYEPACLKVWSVTGGVIRLPLALVCRELQECFGQDSTVELRRSVEVLAQQAQELADQVVESAIENTEAIQSACESLVGLEADVENLASQLVEYKERVADLEQQNNDLQRECAQLRSLVKV